MISSKLSNFFYQNCKSLSQVTQEERKSVTKDVSIDRRLLLFCKMEMNVSLLLSFLHSRMSLKLSREHAAEVLEATGHGRRGRMMCHGRRNGRSRRTPAEH